MPATFDLLGTRAERVQLSQQEVARYSRHLIMPEVAVEGQKRLKAASVLLIGAGGLGSPASLYLAAAGVGRIGIVDDDRVDASNLPACTPADGGGWSCPANAWWKSCDDDCATANTPSTRPVVTGYATFQGRRRMTSTTIS